MQHVIECEAVALGGGILGCALATISLRLVNSWYTRMLIPQRDGMFEMDWPMVEFALAAALVAGLFAGAYPAYRACRIAPALHLKVQ